MTLETFGTWVVLGLLTGWLADLGPPPRFGRERHSEHVRRGRGCPLGSGKGRDGRRFGRRGGLRDRQPAEDLARARVRT